MRDDRYKEPGPQAPTVDEAFSLHTPPIMEQFTHRELASLFAYMAGAAGEECTQRALNHLHRERLRNAGGR